MILKHTILWFVAMSEIIGGVVWAEFERAVTEIIFIHKMFESALIIDRRDAS